jgi:hypothetical protein
MLPLWLLAGCAGAPLDGPPTVILVSMDTVRADIHHNVLPPKGKRAGHHTTRLRDAIDRRRTRLLRGGDRAERLLEAAVGALRAAPPAGIEADYVGGFVARNRGALLGIVRGAFRA